MQTEPLPSIQYGHNSFNTIFPHQPAQNTIINAAAKQALPMIDNQQTPQSYSNNYKLTPMDPSKYASKEPSHINESQSMDLRQLLKPS